MQDTKQALREQIAGAILSLKPAERMALSARAQALLAETPEFKAARAVMVYQSDATEVDTHELILAALASGKRVGLPRTEKGQRVLQVLEILDVQRDLERSRFGFKEPLRLLPAIPLEALDLVVVPGRAFDAQGYRLGRGGGYYDRFLAHPALRALAVALAFDCQIAPSVPHLAHDRQVNLVVTESRIIRTPHWKPRAVIAT
jgi:5-formyltetrahydrofolate cyclo-ligase